MPKKSKLQLIVQKNQIKKNCVTLLPDELNDSKLYANSQINTTIPCRGRPKDINYNKPIALGRTKVNITFILLSIKQ